MSAGVDHWPARCLVAATAVAAGAGIPLGLVLGSWAATGRTGTLPWAGLVQAHGQVQLFGWLGLTILGVTFHAMAHLFRADEPPGRAVAAVLGLQQLGVVLRLAAPLVPGAAGPAGAWLLLGSAVAFVAAFVITLVAHAQTLPRRSRSGGAAPAAGPAVLPRFLLGGLTLWLLALLANLDGGLEAVRRGPAAAGALDGSRDAFVVAAAGGGLALFALGMSLRVVVGWLDLPAPDLGRAARAWWLLAGGAALRAAGAPLDQAAPLGRGLSLLGDLLWALGVLWYLPVLRGLWRPVPGAGGSGDPALRRFVRAAYAWFAVSGGLALGAAGLRLTDGTVILGSLQSGVAAVADAGRHALLFGFLGLLTAGLTGRLPSAFLEVGDAPLVATRAWYSAAWALLLGATALRVAAPLAGAGRPAALVGAGALATPALLCLLVVLGHTARAVARPTRSAR